MNNTSVAISKAYICDLVKILDIQRKAYFSEAMFYSDYTIPPLTETLEEARSCMEDHVILKAEANGIIVGSVRVCLKSKGSNTCLIGRLSVLPEYQKQGVGSALLKVSETVFPGVEFCELFTGSRSERNLKLYERHGYSPVKNSPLSPKVSIVHLSKQLESRQA